MKNLPTASLDKITHFLGKNYKNPENSVSEKQVHIQSWVFPHLRIRLEITEKSSIPSGSIIHYGVHETPFGTWLVALLDQKICAISFSHGRLSDQLQDLSTKWNHAKLIEDSVVTGEMVDKIFDRTKVSDIVSLVFGTPFQLSVWKALLEIPSGSVVSYGIIAESIGRPRAVRAVGTAVWVNPIAYLVPCHRVITGDGSIGQYFGGTDLKISLLGSEMA